MTTTVVLAAEEPLPIIVPLAALLDLPLVQAAQNVVPVAVTAAESVDRLRSWANSRCLSADRLGIFRREEPPAGPRRWVSWKALNN